MNFEQLVSLCQRTHEELLARASRTVDAHLVIRNWILGQYIAEFEQSGADRAEYGARLLERLSERLKPLKIKGTSATRLKLYRAFYRLFPIRPTVSDQFREHLTDPAAIRPTASDLSHSSTLPQTRAFLAEIVNAFPLGWSHYVELLTIDSAEERSFYEIEAAANQWSVRELQRQIASSLYEPVNYFDRHVKLADELPTIGIVLCHRKNDALVELTLPENANIFASRYELYLPSKEELKTRLEQITRELEGGQL